MTATRSDATLIEVSRGERANGGRAGVFLRGSGDRRCLHSEWSQILPLGFLLFFSRRHPDDTAAWTPPAVRSCTLQPCQQASSNASCQRSARPRRASGAHMPPAARARAPPLAPVVSRRARPAPRRACPPPARASASAAPVEELVAGAGEDAAGAPPPLARRRIAVFVEPSPFSHTSGMKNRFLNMVANLSEQGDEARPGQAPASPVRRQVSSRRSMHQAGARVHA